MPTSAFQFNDHIVYPSLCVSCRAAKSEPFFDRWPDIYLDNKHHILTKGDVLLNESSLFHDLD